MSGLRLCLGQDHLLETDRAALPSVLGVCQLLAVPVHWDEAADTLYIATLPHEKEAISTMPKPDDDMPVLVLGPETIVARRQEPLDPPSAPPKRIVKRHKRLITAKVAVEEPATPSPEPVPPAPEVPLSGPINPSTTLHMFQWSRLTPALLRKGLHNTPYLHAFQRDVTLSQRNKNHPR